MTRKSYIVPLAELSETEGVFTTAQAERLGIPRDALHDAAKSGRLERVVRGAYRLVGSGATEFDELSAIWKLTSPAAFTHERMGEAGWDGVVIGGSSAACINGFGDFYLSPYRIYSNRRFNTRNARANFAKRNVAYEDIAFMHDLPVTRPERTIFDLVLDGEDPSLMADALRDASHRIPSFNLEKLRGLLNNGLGDKGGKTFERLTADAGLTWEGAR